MATKEAHVEETRVTHQFRNHYWLALDSQRQPCYHASSNAGSGNDKAAARISK